MGQVVEVREERPPNFSTSQQASVPPNDDEDIMEGVRSLLSVYREEIYTGREPTEEAKGLSFGANCHLRRLSMWGNSRCKVGTYRDEGGKDVLVNGGEMPNTLATRQ